MPSLGFPWVGLRTNLNPALKNPKAWEAIKYAIDYDGMANLYGGGGQFIASCIPPGMANALPVEERIKQDVAPAQTRTPHQRLPAHHRRPRGPPMTAIPEDMIMRHLDLLLTNSEPGATMHYLHVITAPPGAVGPLGLPDEEQLEAHVYAIAPDQTTVDVGEFIAQVIMGAAVEADRKNSVVLFAALSQEVWALTSTEEEDDLELVRRLSREGRVHEHPAAAEATLVYAASRDGRRWRGRRWITGAKAGTTEDVDILVGRPQPGEAPGITAAPLLRRLAGIGATP